jgi:hypothetical protein
MAVRFPKDEHASDVIYRQIVVTTINADAAAKEFAAAHASFVSCGVVAESDGQLGFRKAFVARDPDGDAILVEERYEHGREQRNSSTRPSRYGRSRA